MSFHNIRESFTRTARERGMLAAIGGLAQRATIRYHEKVFDIYTEAVVELPELGINNPDCKAYQATDYASFGVMMRELGVEPREHVFFDYGAGMGRVMVLAATYPFRRVLGIEISSKLADIARRNFERSRPRLRCKEIELETADATQYIPPHDASVLYFNNPFSGDVLDSVLENIHKRAADSTSLFLMCNLPNDSAFEAQVRRLGWLQLLKAVSLPRGRRCLILSSRSAAEHMEIDVVERPHGGGPSR